MTFDGLTFIHESQNDSRLSVDSIVANEQTSQHLAPAITFDDHGFNGNGNSKNAPRNPADNSQDAQLNRMVDDLVGPEEDEDEAKSRSFVPPQPVTHQPHDAWQAPKTPVGPPIQRLHSVSHLWNDTPPQIEGADGMSRTPPYSSPQVAQHGHSRVNSAASIRSRTSVPHPSSFVPTPPYSNSGAIQKRMPTERYANGFTNEGTNGVDSGMHSPLLFGAGGGPWSTTPRRSLTNVTPPNGQGG